MPSWLLAMDVDGTILTDDYAVPAQVREQIQRARSQGIFTALATARAPRSVFHILEDVGGVDAAICFGGALTLKQERGVWRADDAEDDRTVAPELLHALVLRSRSAGVSLAAYGAENVYVDRLNDILAHQFGKTGLTCIEGDLLAVGEPILKLLAIADTQTLPVLEELRGAFGQTLSCLYSHANFLEVTHRSVSKGNAVESLRLSLGIARENVVTIGDSENDLSMFAVAGMPIAMGNAADSVKRSAKWVTETNGRAGVAVALRHCAQTLWRI